MRRMPRRSEFLRLTLFLLLMAAMVAIFTARVKIFLNSRRHRDVVAVLAPGGPPPGRAAAASAGSSGTGTDDAGAAADSAAAVVGDAPAAGDPAAQAAASDAVPAATSAAPGMAPGDALATIRLERDQARGQEREMLQEVMESAAAGEAGRGVAEQRYLELGRTISLEKTLESLLRARGFAEAVVILEPESAQVVLQVSQGPVTAERVAAAAELVSEMSGIKPQDIRIVPRSR